MKKLKRVLTSKMNKKAFKKHVHWIRARGWRSLEALNWYWFLDLFSFNSLVWEGHCQWAPDYSKGNKTYFKIEKKAVWPWKYLYNEPETTWRMSLKNQIKFRIPPRPPLFSPLSTLQFYILTIKKWSVWYPTYNPLRCMRLLRERDYQNTGTRDYSTAPSGLKRE